MAEVNQGSGTGLRRERFDPCAASRPGWQCDWLSWLAGSVSSWQRDHELARLEDRQVGAKLRRVPVRYDGTGP